jgi:hypothetical protein
MHCRDCAHVRDCAGTYAHSRGDAQARKRTCAGVHRCTVAHVNETLRLVERPCSMVPTQLLRPARLEAWCCAGESTGFWGGSRTCRPYPASLSWRRQAAPRDLFLPSSVRPSRSASISYPRNKLPDYRSFALSRNHERATTHARTCAHLRRCTNAIVRWLDSALSAVSHGSRRRPIASWSSQSHVPRDSVHRFIALSHLCARDPMHKCTGAPVRLCTGALSHRRGTA